MKKLVFVALLLPFSLLAQSPGGVSTNLRWWLKADAGVLNASSTAATNGQAVAQWTDQSTIVNHATQGTNAVRPIFQTGVSNGYPSLRFDGTKYLDATAVSGISGATGFDFFVVFKLSSFTAGGTADGAGDYIIDRTSATTPLTSLKIANTDKYFFQQRDDGGSLGGPVSSLSVNTSSFVIARYFRNAGYGLSINGATAITSGNNGALTGPQLRIGRHATSGTGGIKGDITEIATYNAPLSTASRQQIESYLAIKYGITLDQTIATNYFSSAGAVIFPSTTTTDLYENDIAGIGVDNGSGLNQSTSKSQNANSLLTISSPSPALTNGQFMLWGHDSPTISNSANTPPGYSNRLSRVWRVAKTGFTGTVTVSFDVTGLGLTLTDPTKFALLIDADGNFSDATVWTNGRTIVGNVITFTLANFSNLDYFALATDLIPGPGGVGGSVIWLRADKNAYINAGTTLATTNGQKIQQWNNQGQATYNVSQATVANQPNFQLNAVNNNPVIRFASGANDNFLDVASSMLIGGTSSLDYSVVVKPSSTANQGLTSDFAGGYILDRSAATASPNPLFSLKLVDPTLFAFQKRTDANINFGSSTTTSSALTVSPQIVEFFRTYSVQYGILYNGALQNTLAESDGPLTLPNLRIGSAFAGSNVGLNGDIAEIIFYNRTLTTAERTRINTYLAIKYGITLDQSTLTNYVGSDGTTVLYPTASTHSGYKTDIAGIGQDPISSLVQTSSQSTNINSMVAVSTPSNLDNYEFMIWGHNNGSLATANAVDVGAPILVRLSRVWRVAEKVGDVGTVTISVDLTNVPGAKTGTHLRLLIDRNGNGFADNDVAPLTGTLVGQIFTVTGVNFVDGDYFTIGSINNATPLPIQLADFTAENFNSVVQTRWKTETELNNDFFTLERSKEGKEFEEVTTVKGAGTSQSPMNYSFIDRTPYQGLSYYRLKQTDFDGNSTFSKVKSVTIDAPSTFSVIVYPNPTKGSQFSVQFNSTVQGEAMVEIFSLTGQRLFSEVRSDLQPGVNNWEVIPSSALLPGLYLARVSVGGRSFVTKVLVQ